MTTHTAAPHPGGSAKRASEDEASAQPGFDRRPPQRSPRSSPSSRRRATLRGGSWSAPRREREARARPAPSQEGLARFLRRYRRRAHDHLVVVVGNVAARPSRTAGLSDSLLNCPKHGVGVKRQNPAYASGRAL